MRRFNITGLCIPEEDYMVDLSGKIKQIRKLIDNRSYFTINRARQFGKTTVLSALKRALKDEYTVVSISFESLDDEDFESNKAFCAAFVELVERALKNVSAPDELISKWTGGVATGFRRLSDKITAICKGAKLVLMIDEVDKTSNNRVFLHFLSMLRSKFLARKEGEDYTFHCVILAGVYDIKNIKLKMLQEGAYAPGKGEGNVYNSPWNIAADFEVDLSFCPEEIESMLFEYEHDHNTGMDIKAVSHKIFEYTSGYPFLVSRICLCIDENPSIDWTARGVQSAVQMLVIRNNTLYDDISKNLENSSALYDLIYDILIIGEQRMYSISNPTINMAIMYGILKRSGQSLVVSNRIFEMVICNYLISKDEEKKRKTTWVTQHDVVRGGSFDMELCMRKFSDHFSEIYSERDIEFLERHGRLLFLSYLKPLINGQGFYHIESQFTDLRRMDIVVDFGRQQFIIELKIWHGDKYQAEAYEQLCAYLDSKNLSEGYLLTFDFRKNKDNAYKAQWIETNGKRIFSVIA